MGSGRGAAIGARREPEELHPAERVAYRVSASGLPHPLSDDLVELLVERMGLLGDRTRIRILDELRGGERNVQSLADALLL